ncbi:hypothetical protein KDA11_05425, partial [Candidatus Saccharibacteria bacterium]|nr:hypothetical protein [Candidatus Saccharibacteria bacterium]
STINHITEGNRRHIDVLYIKVASDNGTWRRYAHSYIGFGVTPEIGRELTQAQLNKANEVIISLKSFLKSKPFTIIEQVKTNEYQSIVISNIAKMSKVLGLAKDSTVNDGLFEIFALPPGKAFMLGVIVKSATVGLRYTKQTDKYVFKTVNKQPVQLDGEVFDIPANALVTVGIEQRNLACIV